MHINTTGIGSDTDFWLMGLWVLLAIAAIAAGGAGIGFGVQLLDEVKRKRFGIGVMALGTGVAAGCIAMLVLSAGNNSAGHDRVHNELRQQAQARYGVALNGEQAADLINYCGYNGGYECGDAYILRDGKPVKVTLYHIGDTWLLGQGQTNDQFRELPRA